MIMVRSYRLLPITVKDLLSFFKNLIHWESGFKRGVLCLKCLLECWAVVNAKEIYS